MYPRPLTQGGQRLKNTIVMSIDDVHASPLLVHDLGDDFIAPSFEAWWHRPRERKSQGIAICALTKYVRFFIKNVKFGLPGRQPDLVRNHKFMHAFVDRIEVVDQPNLIRKNCYVSNVYIYYRDLSRTLDMLSDYNTSTVDCTTVSTLCHLSRRSLSCAKVCVCGWPRSSQCFKWCLQTTRPPK